MSDLTDEGFDPDEQELAVILTGYADRANLSQPSSSELLMPRVELPCPFADYVLEAEIGRGGMGIVYRATRNSDGEPVAIKMILKGDFATEAEKKRFDAEAEAVAKMDHDSRAFAVGTFDAWSDE